MRIARSKLALLAAAGCLHAACASPVACVARQFAYGRRAIPSVQHAGDRVDAPPLAERGNGVFVGAAFDPTGSLLITLPYFGSAPMHVWDTSTGTIVSSLEATVPGNNTDRIWMIDGPRRRLFAQNANGREFALFDLMDGRMISTVPYQQGGRRPFPIGLNADGQALVFTPGFIELWDLDPPRIARREPTVFADERYVPNCVAGVGSTYHPKHCWEWSADRRTLALAYNPEKKVGADTEFILIDTATLQRQPLERPPGLTRQTFAYFAFSPDNRWLAVGTHDGMKLYDRGARKWGPTISGDHPRNAYLAPIRFTADSARVIALGDQLQISVYLADSGMLIGRLPTIKDDWEGVIEASADGSRVLVYRFSSDTIEVVDGHTAARIGWVCPYYCNMRHNPVQVPYAVSPDGRSVAASHRRGAAVWNTDTDTIRFPLHDPARKPLPYPAEP